MEDTTNNLSAESQISSGSVESVAGLISNLNIKALTEENLEDILLGTISAIAEHFGADHGYIVLKGNEEQPANVVNIHRDKLDDSMVAASYSVIDAVMEKGNTIIVTDAMISQRFPGDPSFQRFNVNTAICVAVKTTEMIFGVIYIDSSNKNNWDDNRLRFLEFIGEHLGLAINNTHLQQANQENHRLVAAGKACLQLSHSVKNILQMVGGATEVIDFGLRTNEIHRVKRSWDILKPNIERLRKFTLDMLDYSKERTLELGKCDFNRIIQDSIESLHAQLKMKQSKLNIRVDPNMPIIELDSERIHEMSLNLILNAIDIVDEHNGIVSVETKYLQSRGEVELDVSDNGPGMNDEIKEKIFTPFESGKNKFGTGLGMPIAKQVIDQHNGRIEIESEIDKGTTFKVFLPVKLLE